MMDHPNIAHVLDAGATDSGRPYFVMELVEGVPITQYCDDAKLTIRQRLELFVSLCEAVQHAHQKGIIHRDIKPSNILVALNDGQAVPKIIDFGIAKATSKQLTDETVFTQDGQIVGTPLYMSPEQAEANGQDVDTRSDIYSLGVLLYELLTGTTPFDKEQVRKAGLDEVRRLIREEEPLRPSERITTLGMAATTVSEDRKTEPAKLRRLLRGELDWIVMKALEKDRTRRYETANAFARDVQRYLNDEPVEASPPSTLYRVRKFVQRHRERLVFSALVGTLGLVTLCTLAAHSLRNAGRIRELEQEVGQALAGAETAFEAGDLALAGRRVAEAQGRLGADRSTLHGLAAKADRVQQEIEDRKVDEARLRQFLKMATDAQDKMSYAASLGGKQVAEDAIKMYGIETDRDWLSRLEHLHLTAEERQEVRETAYVTLVSLADFYVRWPGSGDDAQCQQRSMELLERARTFHEPTRAFYFVRSECYRLRGNQTAADEDLRQFKAAPARTAWDYYLPGHTAGWRGKRDEEIEAYKAALRLQPDHYNSLFFLALRSQQDGDYATAAHIFRACLALRPDHVAALRNRASALAQLGEYAEALELARKAIWLQPDGAVPHFSLGNALRDQGKLDEAVTCYRQAIRLQPNFPEAHNNVGNILEEQGNLEEAIAEYREALGITPFREAYIAYTNLGLVFSSQGKLGEAIAQFQEAIQLKPDWAGAHSSLGLTLKEQGKLEEAVASYRRAIEITERLVAENPAVVGYQHGLAGTYHNLAVVLVTTGQRDAAEQLYLKAIGLSEKVVEDVPDVARYRVFLANHYGDLGELLTAAGRHDEAEELYGKAIELRKKLVADSADAPGHHDRLAGGYTELGSLLLDVGRHKESERLLREAVDLSEEVTSEHPDVPDYRERLGRCCYDLGRLLHATERHEEAEQSFRKAIKTTTQLAGDSPDVPSYNRAASWYLATCPCEDLRNPRAAVELAKKAAEREPKAGESWKKLGVAQYRAGDFSESIAALNKSLELNCAEQAASMFFLATAHWKLGEKEQARKCYDQALHWMEKNKREGEELGRFRREAAELLGIAEEPDQTDASGASDEKEKPPTEGSEEKPNAEVKQDKNES